MRNSAISYIYIDVISSSIRNFSAMTKEIADRSIMIYVINSRVQNCVYRKLENLSSLEERELFYY